MRGVHRERHVADVVSHKDVGLRLLLAGLTALLAAARLVALLVFILLYLFIDGLAVFDLNELRLGGYNLDHRLRRFHHDLEVRIRADKDVRDIIRSNGRLNSAHLIVRVRNVRAFLAADQFDILAVFTSFKSFYKVCIAAGCGSEIARFQLRIQRAVEPVQVKLRTERRGEVRIFVLRDGDVIFRRLLDEIPRIGERQIFAVHAVKDKLEGVSSGVGDTIGAIHILRAIVISVHVERINHSSFLIGDFKMEVGLIQNFVSDFFTEELGIILTAGDIDIDRGDGACFGDVYFFEQRIGLHGSLIFKCGRRDRHAAHDELRLVDHPLR